MSYVRELNPGFRYGLGSFSGEAGGTAGQAVKLSGNNEFAVQTSAAARSFGILAGDADDGDPCGVFCHGGIYETDLVAEGVSADGNLAWDPSAKKFKAAGEGDFVVGQAIAVVSGVLTFKLLV